MIDIKLFQKSLVTLRFSLKPSYLSYVTASNCYPVKCHGEYDTLLSFGIFVLRHNMIVGDLDGCEPFWSMYRCLV